MVIQDFEHHEVSGGVEKVFTQVSLYAGQEFAYVFQIQHVSQSPSQSYSQSQAENIKMKKRLNSENLQLAEAAMTQKFHFFTRLINGYVASNRASV
jgi:hypothetical protein